MGHCEAEGARRSRSPAAKRRAAPACSVSVTTLAGEVLGPLDIRDGDTVAALKERLARDFSVPRMEQELVSGGKVLEEDCELAQVAAAADDGGKRELSLTMVRSRGRWALSGSHDHELKLWDLSKGACTQRLSGHRSWVLDLSVDWSTGRALSASDDFSLILWDLQSATALREFYGHTASVMCLAVDWAAQRALSGSFDRSLRTWDLAPKPADGTGQLGELRGHRARVQSVVMDWPSQRALSGSGDRTLILWDLKTGNAIGHCRGHRATVSCLAANWPALRAVSGSFDGSWRLWDLKCLECLRSFSVGPGGQVRCLTVDWPAQQAFLGCGSDGGAGGRLLLVDLETGKHVQELRRQKDAVRSVAADWQSRRLVSGSTDGTVRHWDLESGSCLLELRSHEDAASAVALQL